MPLILVFGRDEGLGSGAFTFLGTGALGLAGLATLGAGFGGFFDVAGVD